MVITGLVLVYAVPVRSAQSVWFRFKVILLIAAAVNAFIFHKNMTNSDGSWDADVRAPINLRIGAMLSLVFWALIVIFGRFIAYNWFDCEYTDPGLSQFLAGCVAGQTQF